MATNKIEKASLTMDNPFNPNGTIHNFCIFAFNKNGKAVGINHSISGKYESVKEALLNLYKWFNMTGRKNADCDQDSVRCIYYKGAATIG